MKDTSRHINQIPRDKKKSGVIMFGRGPSVDRLDIEAINTQKKYDTCTITDAIKLLSHPTYAFNYHYQGFRRISNHANNPKYLIMPTNIHKRLADKKWFTYLHQLKALTNDYYFLSRTRNNLAVFTQGLFDIEVTDKLFNRNGSVVGVVNFLCGYMHYDTIYYIGFDGGTKYGELVHTNRKESKIEGAARDYAESWKTVQIMLKHYSNVTFEPLREFLK